MKLFREIISFALATFFLIVPASFASSSMGTAIITDSKGIQCFSIPKNWGTRSGLPLYSLTISQLRNGSFEEIFAYVWSFQADDLEAPPKIFPNKCIRYGENPAGTTRLTLMPMEPNTLYYVSIRAQNDVSNVFAYTGIFCIRLKLSKGVFVQVVPRDRSLGEARFAACFN